MLIIYLSVIDTFSFLQMKGKRLRNSVHHSIRCPHLMRQLLYRNVHLSTLPASGPLYDVVAGWEAELGIPQGAGIVRRKYALTSCEKPLQKSKVRRYPATQRLPCYHSAIDHAAACERVGKLSNARDFRYYRRAAIRMLTGEFRS